MASAASLPADASSSVTAPVSLVITPVVPGTSSAAVSVPGEVSPPAGSTAPPAVSVSGVPLVSGTVSPEGAICGRPVISDRIVGGVDAAAGQWPWQVSLQQNNAPLCGGSVITDSWVLTAAHCFETPLDISGYEVYIGAYNLSILQNPQTVSRKVKQVIINPAFTEEGSSGDIALVQLDTPLKFTPYILPACLPSQSVDLTVGTMCWVTGWGGIKEGVPLPSPQTLQMVQVALIANANCNYMYQSSMGLNPNLQLIHNDMVCAGYQQGNKDSCQGDSGGPLVCNVNGVWLQYGIVSWGYGCAQLDHPGVYTRTQYYQSWLRRYVPSLPYSDGGNVLSPNILTPNSTVMNSTGNATFTKQDLWPGNGAHAHVGSMVIVMLFLLSLVLVL
ncbi:serine protease 27-like [Pseudophryne corroboree]|uniref:serine protease 27-like n=1 Tax=Pseudophryne corroboree TaxID=495146 RepID=UPI003081D80D